MKYFINSILIVGLILSSCGSNKKKETKLIEYNQNQIIYFLPPSILSTKNDSCIWHFDNKYLIEYNNKLFFNGKLIGNVFKGDTIILKNNKIEIL